MVELYLLSFIYLHVLVLNYIIKDRDIFTLPHQFLKIENNFKLWSFHSKEISSLKSFKTVGHLKAIR
jgi:hypothetical protein